MRTIADREERFRARISTERQVLAAINGAFADVQPIPALSLPAISLWITDARKIYRIEQLGTVEPLLRELSERLRIETDNSREVLDVPSADQARPIKLLVQRITDLCNRALMSSAHQTSPIATKDTAM